VKISQEEKTKFKEFAQYLFDQDRLLDFISDRTSPENNVANIERYSSEYQFEIAPKTGFLHLHALVEIQHTGFLRFNVNQLRAYAKNLFGRNLYIHAPISANENVLWRNYIKKSEVIEL
jgi:hypothetical protein